MVFTDAISGVCLITALSALIVYIMPDYDREGITPDQISNLFTFPNLFLGLGNLVSMPIAVAVGRRPVILASNVLLFLAAVLCATNRSYYWHLGGRMVAAFAAAQCQALALLILQVWHTRHKASASRAILGRRLTSNASGHLLSPPARARLPGLCVRGGPPQLQFGDCVVVHGRRPGLAVVVLALRRPLGRRHGPDLLLRPRDGVRPVH